jgi:hypothetical protein
MNQESSHKPAGQELPKSASLAEIDCNPGIQESSEEKRLLAIVTLLASNSREDLCQL